MKNSKRHLVSLFVLTCGTIHAGNVVTDWNTIASTTIVTNGGKSPAASSVWFAYSSLAVYDAVNAITGQYQPFYYRFAAPANASTGAAAVAAAHRVLVNYFPSQQNVAGQPIHNVLSRRSPMGATKTRASPWVKPQPWRSLVPGAMVWRPTLPISRDRVRAHGFPRRPRSPLR